MHEQRKGLPKLANFLSTVIPQSDGAIVSPLLTLDGTSAARRNRSAIVRESDAEDCDFMTSKEALALARRQTPHDSVAIKEL